MNLPTFDIVVEDNGYAWWYVDAMSDDGRHGLTLIAFVGSVFSPYYAWQRERGVTDPEDHCSINLAIYGPGARWNMTERSKSAITREATRFQVGPSALAWNGDQLTIDIDEWAVPLPRRVRGQIRVTPSALPGKSFNLDAAGRHRWWPVAPHARVEATFEHPALSWRGHGYLDHNHGDEPVERGFTDWQWSRTDLGDETAILYDANRQDGTSQSLALRFDRQGELTRFEPPPWVRLPTTGWRMPRSTRAEKDSARVVETWEDTPFYARSHLESAPLGKRASTIHESLSLDRFSRRWVQILLPFRMPRRP